MKIIPLFCAGAFLFNIGLLPIRGEVGDGTLVGEVLEQLEKNDAMSVVGFEYVNGCRDKIADTVAIQAAIRQLDFPNLSKIVAAETDYECLTGKDYIVIIPKDDPAKYDTALARRMVVFPNAAQVPVDDFLKQVKGVDQANRNSFVDLGGPLMAATYASGPVSIENGKCLCFQLLNELTVKLKARSWCIEHMWFPDPKTGKPEMPAMLGLGSVSIYARPSLGWVDCRH